MNSAINSAFFLQSSAWLFVVTAAGGMVMALIRCSGRETNPPAWLAMLHGFLAAAGLTLLVFAALTVGIPGIALGGLALLLIAAGGGVLMNLVYHLKDVPLPKRLMVVHATLAIIGSGMVVVAALGER